MGVDAATADRADTCIDNGVFVPVITGGTLQISPPFVVGEHGLRFPADALGDALDATAT